MELTTLFDYSIYFKLCCIDFNKKNHLTLSYKNTS